MDTRAVLNSTTNNVTTAVAAIESEPKSEDSPAPGSEAGTMKMTISSASPPPPSSPLGSTAQNSLLQVQAPPLQLTGTPPARTADVCIPSPALVSALTTSLPVPSAPFSKESSDRGELGQSDRDIGTNDCRNSANTLKDLSLAASPSSTMDKGVATVGPPCVQTDSSSAATATVSTVNAPAAFSPAAFSPVASNIVHSDERVNVTLPNDVSSLSNAEGSCSVQGVAEGVTEKSSVSVTPADEAVFVSAIANATAELKSMDTIILGSNAMTEPGAVTETLALDPVLRLSLDDAGGVSGDAFSKSVVSGPTLNNSLGPTSAVSFLTETLSGVPRAESVHLVTPVMAALADPAPLNDASSDQRSELTGAHPLGVRSVPLGDTVSTS